MIVIELSTILFWSVTYLLIVFSDHFSIKSKKVAMPYIAGVLNFAWEICAIYETRGSWGFILWFCIDLIIVYYGIKFLPNIKQKIFYLISIVLCTVGLFFVFQSRNGLIHSVYIIDLIMAICYLIERKKLSPHFKTSIAVTKLIGDGCAGIVFGTRSDFVAMIAVMVFLCNAIYTCLCIKDKMDQIHEKK